MIKRLNPKHLERLLKNECDIKLYQEGLSEEGEPLSSLILTNLKCRFVEKIKTVIDADGKKVILLGKAILLGDIAPTIKKISGGEITIEGTKCEIYQASRPRNPDGSVYMTVLELM